MFLPIAVDKTPLAIVLDPIAVEEVPLASVLLPAAKDVEPVAWEVEPTSSESAIVRLAPNSEFNPVVSFINNFSPLTLSESSSARM